MFNNWHAGIPGSTMINRAYIDSATSDGMGNNDVDDILLGYPQRTIYEVRAHNDDRARVLLKRQRVCRLPRRRWRCAQSTRLNCGRVATYVGVGLCRIWTCRMLPGR